MEKEEKYELYELSEAKILVNYYHNILVGKCLNIQEKYKILDVLIDEECINKYRVYCKIQQPKSIVHLIWSIKNVAINLNIQLPETILNNPNQ